ncbi:MAG: aspartate kinase [Alistipes sp.]|jgi:aspartate kinase|nr:aspartate kinase [Alistipes sp.]
MKVYKFGGASVRSAEGVKNLKHIVEDERGGLFIIVSAMGKTTNALEGVVDHFMAGRKNEALAEFAAVENYHAGIITGLFDGGTTPPAVQKLYDEARAILAEEKPAESDFERVYDAIVSYGELVSTTIISEYLNAAGVRNRWVDMRRALITDERFKYANVDMDASGTRLRAVVDEATAEGFQMFVGQGFIGATPRGETTTLGREGSDYSAAVVASLLDAESVAIWKDVIGVLNADPKIFPESTFIPELTYLDAVELAFSGAQIIHPKTIKPLQNKNIPLHVRPFGDKFASGSVIRGEIATPIEVPILILKRGQVLLQVRPRDYSFVLEEKLGDIFAILEKFNTKVNLVQTSAVSMSLSIDRTRRLGELVRELESHGFFVTHDEGMELLTIRGYTTAYLERYSRHAPDVLLAQRTRKILRLVRKETE